MVASSVAVLSTPPEPLVRLRRTQKQEQPSPSESSASSSSSVSGGITTTGATNKTSSTRANLGQRIGEYWSNNRQRINLVPPFPGSFIWVILLPLTTGLLLALQSWWNNQVNKHVIINGGDDDLQLLILFVLFVLVVVVAVMVIRSDQQQQHSRAHPSQLHREALECLEDVARTTPVKKERSVVVVPFLGWWNQFRTVQATQRSEALLRQALVVKEPKNHTTTSSKDNTYHNSVVLPGADLTTDHYAPAALSLAALYTYRCNKGAAALRVLTEYPKAAETTRKDYTNNDGDDDLVFGEMLLILQLDAQALVATATTDDTERTATDSFCQEGDDLGSYSYDCDEKEDYFLSVTFAEKNQLPANRPTNSDAPTSTKWLLRAGAAGAAFVAVVVHMSILRMMLYHVVVFTGGDLSNKTIETNKVEATPLEVGGETCYSVDVIAEESLPFLSYPFNGTLREAPLPRRIRWQAQAGPEEWQWPPAPPRRERGDRNKPLWYVRGVAYDLNEFAQHHPGGYRYILNSGNEDITELFEAHHIGHTAREVIESYRYVPLQDQQDLIVPTYKGHSSHHFRELKEKIFNDFDLNDLKMPSTEYTMLFWATVISHLSLFGACLAAPVTGSTPWLLHTAWAYTGVWLGGFAHNGLHLWPRRKAETLTMYIIGSNNPFRWMKKHIVDHHVYTNTCFDGDKPVVKDFQKWINERPWMNFIGLAWGSFLIGVQSSCCQKPSSDTMTPLEQLLPLLLLALIVVAGLLCQGRRWILRFSWSLCIMSFYSFLLFQVSHYQPELLDGDNIHATTDDWGEFQLKTTWGWFQMDRPLLNMVWLNLNLQPMHHMFPAVHHSKLREITPLVREHYPDLMEDHVIFPHMMWNMFSILFGFQCVQPK